MKSPKKRFRETFRRRSLYFEYFEYFEIQKNQNIQNIFVLANFFEYFEIFEIQKNQNIQNIFVLAKFYEYFEYFEIQKNQNIQNIQKILKSPKKRFRETFGRSSLYFWIFWNSKKAKNKEHENPKSEKLISQ